MADDSHNTPKLSERFSDLFGVEVREGQPESDRVSNMIYLEESRKLSLNKLLHLVPYSEVLLLTGGLGVGKTTLLNLFVARGATTWKTAFISASALMGPGEFLRSVAQGFGLEIAGDAGIDDLLWELERHIQALGRSGRRAIIIIDDAHVLTDDVLHQAEKLLRAGEADNAISLLLSMRQEYESKLEQFAVLHDKLAYTLQIAPLTRKEVQGYLHLKLADSRHDLDQIFTPEVLDELVKNSGGLPESINELAQDILANHGVRRPAARVGAPSSAKPLKYGVVGVVVLAVAAVLYFQDDINQMFEQPSVQVAQQTQQIKPLSLEPETPLGESEPLTLGDEGTLPQEVAKQVEQVVEMAEPAVVAPEVTEAPLEAAAEPASTPSSMPAAEAPAEPVVIEQPPEVESIVAKAEPEPEPVVAEPETDPELAWIDSQPDTNYTMQLMALVDHDKVLEFVAKQDIDADSATYIKMRKGKPLMVLVYGSYANHAEAATAAKKIPKKWYVGEPWIRSFASVKAEVSR